MRIEHTLAMQGGRRSKNTEAGAVPIPMCVALAAAKLESC
jgi:hypothetical protein